jgi:hypothetical protein
MDTVCVGLEEFGQSMSLQFCYEPRTSLKKKIKKPVSETECGLLSPFSNEKRETEHNMHESLDYPKQDKKKRKYKPRQHGPESPFFSCHSQNID